MKRLERTDIGAAVATLGTAFFEDSLVCRLCPQEARRFYRTEPVFRFSANMAVGYGEAWAIGNDGAVIAEEKLSRHHRPLAQATTFVSHRTERECFDGSSAAIPHSLRAVALWQYSWRMNCPLWRWVQYGALDIRRRLGASAYRELTSVSARIDAMRERVAPDRYLYLSSLGVEPQYRRSGLARSLVQPRIQQAAAEGLNTIVETNGEAALAFYRSVGFVVRAESTISGLRYLVLEYRSSVPRQQG